MGRKETHVLPGTGAGLSGCGGGVGHVPPTECQVGHGGLSRPWAGSTVGVQQTIGHMRASS